MRTALMRTKTSLDKKEPAAIFRSPPESLPFRSLVETLVRRGRSLFFRGWRRCFNLVIRRCALIALETLPAGTTHCGRRFRIYRAIRVRVKTGLRKQVAWSNSRAQHTDVEGLGVAIGHFGGECAASQNPGCPIGLDLDIITGLDLSKGFHV